jgi:hypothetical protein
MANEGTLPTALAYPFSTQLLLILTRHKQASHSAVIHLDGKLRSSDCFFPEHPSLYAYWAELSGVFVS